MTQAETSPCCSSSEGCSSNKDAGGTGGVSGVTPVDCATVKQWLDAGEAVLIDVREPMEHVRQSVPGAALLPLGKVAKDQLPDTNGRKLVVHCKSGARSQKACDKLAAAGVEVYTMTGGIDAWAAAGLATHENPNAPLDLFRQVQIVVGGFVLLFALLALGTGSMWFLIVPIFFGGGLLFAGLTGFCGLAMVLGKMPWNRVNVTSCAAGGCKAG